MHNEIIVRDELWQSWMEAKNYPAASSLLSHHNTVLCDNKLLLRLLFPTNSLKYDKPYHLKDNIVCKEEKLDSDNISILVFKMCNGTQLAQTCIHVLLHLIHTVYTAGPTSHPPLCLLFHPCLCQPPCLLLSPTRSFIILSEQQCQQHRLNGLFQNPFGPTSIKDHATLMGDSSRRRWGYMSAWRPGDGVTMLGRNLNSGGVNGDRTSTPVNIRCRMSTDLSKGGIDFPLCPV